MKHSSKISKMALLVVLLTSSLAACGGGNEEGGNGPSIMPTPSNISFLDVAMSQQEIDALEPGNPAYAMVEREDGIHFEPIVLGQRYYEYITFKDTQLRFGAGDSGSPILDGSGKTIGALSGTFGGDDVTITPITIMMAAVGRVLQSTASFQNKLAWYATGLSTTQRQNLRDAGIPVSDFDIKPMMPTARAAGGGCCLQHLRRPFYSSRSV